MLHGAELRFQWNVALGRRRTVCKEEYKKEKKKRRRKKEEDFTLATL